MLAALLKKILGSLLRHALGGAGVGIVVDGLLTGDQLKAAVGAVTTLVGVGSSLLKAVKEAKVDVKTSPVAKYNL